MLAIPQCASELVELHGRQLTHSSFDKSDGLQ